MMRVALIAATLLLAGCEKEDRRVELLEEELGRTVLPSERCRVTSRIADVHLEQGDAEKYRLATAIRDIECLRARQGY